MIVEYEKQVYTSMLGKVIGVYLGRPYEGWAKKDIEAKWGQIDHYVHEDQKAPLVIADDDISGTFTFIKILADSGLYEETPDRLYGENWLNYLLEGQSVLWWGGVSLSTEHTAFINLKNGIESPRSGSMAVNGREVAEQIGAQIFIDAFGMVAPGNPALAVELAEKAARVSHDGEAVYAAQIVAAMVSLAFEVKDIDRILDEAIHYIPEDSLIAQVHRDVRAWAKADGDWRKTFDRIDEKYGYKIYGGNCHVIPNHAIMVMAWAYSKNDFFEAMKIICTAGWDTDCNAANVGSVSALVAGLEHLGDTYDFRTPFADRIFIPTADGTDVITDVLHHSEFVADIGRRIMKMGARVAPKNGARHHFEMLGAVQGYRAEGSAKVVNALAPQDFAGQRCLSLRFDLKAGEFSRLLTPTSFDPSGQSPWYAVMATPNLYKGMTVRAVVKCVGLSAPASLCMLVTTSGGEVFKSPFAVLELDGKATLEWNVESSNLPILYFGFEVAAPEASVGEVLIDSVDFGGRAELNFPEVIQAKSAREIDGWISNLDSMHWRFSNDVQEIFYFGKNAGLGVVVTGNRSWKDCTATCEFKIHAATRAGLLLRYQGLRRYYAVVFTTTSLQILRNCYGETLLAEVPFTAEENRLYTLEVSACGDTISVSVNGDEKITVQDSQLDCGGFGFTVERGLAGFRALHVVAETRF